tara:strand:- start:2698 stop:3336 length:639 start_codon:yes stop_codon:yes gene_type:complete
MANNSPLESSDKRLREFLPSDSDFRDAVWLHKQSGMKIIKHKYLKQIAGLQKIKPIPSSVDLKFYPELNKATCFLSVENAEGQQFCSVAEADPKNNKNAYPVMMAYKRALDRAILEALNLQGFFYADSEIPLTEEQPEAASNVESGSATKNKASKQVLSMLINKLQQAQTLEALEANRQAIKQMVELESLTQEDKDELTAVYNTLRTSKKNE